MTDLKDKAWTCINRWERRGYETQVETFKAVMAENERLRDALKTIAATADWKTQLTISNDALEGK